MRLGGAFHDAANHPSSAEDVGAIANDFRFARIRADQSNLAPRCKSKYRIVTHGGTTRSIYNIVEACRKAATFLMPLTMEWCHGLRRVPERDRPSPASGRRQRWRRPRQCVRPSRPRGRRPRHLSPPRSARRNSQRTEHCTRTGLLVAGRNIACGENADQAHRSASRIAAAWHETKSGSTHRIDLHRKTACLDGIGEVKARAARSRSWLWFAGGGGGGQGLNRTRKLML